MYFAATESIDAFFGSRLCFIQLFSPCKLDLGGVCILFFGFASRSAKLPSGKSLDRRILNLSPDHAAFNKRRPEMNLKIGINLLRSEGITKPIY